MRTAITIAKTHKGEWKLLATPDDNLLDQKKDFVAQRTAPAHDELSTLIYQESDGEAQIKRFLTPAEKKAHDDQNAKDHAEHQAFIKAQQEKDEKRKQQIAENLKPKAKKK